MRVTDIVKWIVSIAVPLIAGFGSLVWTINSIPTSHASLNKPWFTPPNAVFAYSGPDFVLLA